MLFQRCLFKLQEHLRFFLSSLDEPEILIGSTTNKVLSLKRKEIRADSASLGLLNIIENPGCHDPNLARQLSIVLYAGELALIHFGLRYIIQVHVEHTY